MKLFNRKPTGGFMDEIRCDEPSYLIWKWHPKGSVTGNNNRENAIGVGIIFACKRWRSCYFFVYEQKTGTQCTDVKLALRQARPMENGLYFIRTEDIHGG